MGTIFRQYREIDIYNIYAPKCNLAQTTVSSADDEALKYGDHVRDR
jgi:serine carboxypeptidase-like clade 2